jgi:hypothetical protein
LEGTQGLFLKNCGVNERICIENMDDACDLEIYFFTGLQICVKKFVGKHVHKKVVATIT